MVSAFQGLLFDPKEWKLGSIGLSFERLDVAEASCLENPFTKEEVFLALGEFCVIRPLDLMVFLWLFGRVLWSLLRRRLWVF